MALGLGLVGDAVGLVHGGDVVAQRDGLHRLVHAAAHRAPHLGGQRQPLHGRGVLRLLGDKRNQSTVFSWGKKKPNS